MSLNFKNCQYYKFHGKTWNIWYKITNIAKTINFPEKPGICVIEILSMYMYFFNFNHFNLKTNEILL